MTADVVRMGVAHEYPLGAGTRPTSVEPQTQLRQMHAAGRILTTEIRHGRYLFRPVDPDQLLDNFSTPPPPPWWPANDSTWRGPWANLTRVGISPQQFQQLQARVAAPRRRAEPVLPAVAVVTSSPRHAIILGIDPSLRGTGWGVIRAPAGRESPVALGHGTIQCPASWPRSRCLVRIAAELREAIRTLNPSACAIEGLFFAQNLRTALTLGEARGVCLLAAAEAGLEIHEMAPRKIKQAIVGFGGAQKPAVARMVQRLLGLPEPPAADAADALAVALAFTQESRRHPLGGSRSL